MTRKLVVGNVPRKVLPPTTVRPPTESGSPASALSNLRCANSSATASTSTHDWLIPSGRIAGDGLLIFINTEGGSGAGAVTPPSGYTLLDSQDDATNHHYVYWKISDGTENDTTYTTAGASEATFVCGRIAANGSTLPTPDITGYGTTPGTSSHDPSAITPAAGAGTYHVIVALLMNVGSVTPDDETGASTGYTFLTYCTTSGGVFSPRIWVEQKASVAITTTEDPGAVAWSAPIGSRYYRSYTIAIPVTQSDPQVVGFPVTASDIDTESATDGQVLTSDGAGNAAWEDPTGVSDHGALTGLADDDHTQYVLADGTRAFTGDQSMGSNKLTNVTDPTAAQDAATKAYVDANTTRFEVLVYNDGSGLEALANEAGTDWLYVEV